MLLSERELDIIWEQIYQRFHFIPSADKDVIPFQLPKPWAVYDISDIFAEWGSDFTDAVNRVLLSCMTPGERLYALDWQHSGFLFDPKNQEEQKVCFVKDERYHGGGYNAYFPLYVPDGDYYFFLPQDFRFGYLGHPWRQEVWLFGEDLVNTFQKAIECEPAFSGFQLKESSK